MAAPEPPRPGGIAWRPRQALAPLLVALALAVLCAWTYRAHLAGELVFPWDFAKTYHAVPFFWISAASEGLLGEWIPFQGVGYPLAMNLQSGLWYPPLWVFVATGATYSLHAAVVLQVVHVLLGGLGAAAFARRCGAAWPWALVAGAAYQLSGGFFSNAEHVDIVRGYAWTPWLLLAATVDAGERGLGPPRARALPFVVFAMLTGAYPGQGVALLVLVPLFLAAQLAGTSGPWRLDRTRVRGVGLRCAYLGLGVGMALGHLLPAWMARAELLRADAEGLERTGLDLAHVFTTLLPYDAAHLAGNVTMRSLFFTAPVLVGLFLLRASDLRRALGLVVLGLAAAALLDGGAVLEAAASVFPPLGLSRFPAADHRAFLLVPAVVLGVRGLERALVPPTIPRWSRLARTVALLAFAWAGLALWRREGALEAADARMALGLLAATVAVVALGRAWRVPARMAPWAVLALAVLDGTRMHAAVPEPWRGREAVRARARAAVEEDFDAKRAELADALRARPERRPARRPQPTLDGYLRGVHVFHDYAAGDHLRAVAELMESRPLGRIVRAEGDPVLLAPDAELVPIAKALARPLEAELGRAEPLLWSPRELRYAVTTSAPAVLVENEVAFPGWRAARAEDGIALEPVPEAWPLRAWRVPAGEHEVVLTFRMPGRTPAMVVAGIAMVAWLVVLVAGGRRRREQTQAAASRGG